MPPNDKGGGSVLLSTLGRYLAPDFRSADAKVSSSLSFRDSALRGLGFSHGSSIMCQVARNLGFRGRGFYLFLGWELEHLQRLARTNNR